MPDRRKRRGPAPEDSIAFAEEAIEGLRSACNDLSWLLTRRYPSKASLALVGDRHRLTSRQRKALQRTAASDQACARRAARRVTPQQLRGQTVEIDGYNVLLTVEAALSGGLLLLARDGALRDLAALARHYKHLEVTRPALRCLGRWLEEARVREVLWWFDRPISNSGRLAGVLREEAQDHGWAWQVDCIASPDAQLRQSANVLATADSAILDDCTRWVSLARHVVEDSVAPEQDVWLLDLSPSPA
ncbi:MAG: DUF434 domain-containing protein [Acidobacteriota bacterium]